MTNLLLAAFPPELGDYLAQPPAGWRAACTGIGALKTAAMASQWLMTEKPRRVLFVGTCGAYGSALAIGEVVSAKKVLSISTEELEGRAYRPAAETVSWKVKPCPGFPEVVVACPPAITRCERCTDGLATVAAVEHLEAAGVCAAVNAFSEGHPGQEPLLQILLVVANGVGPQAHQEWLAHQASVSRHLADVLQTQGILSQ